MPTLVRRNIIGTAYTTWLSNKTSRRISSGHLLKGTSLQHGTLTEKVLDKKGTPKTRHAPGGGKVFKTGKMLEGQIIHVVTTRELEGEKWHETKKVFER